MSVPASSLPPKYQAQIAAQMTERRPLLGSAPILESTPLAGKRIRQKTASKMNKLEAEYLARLKVESLGMDCEIYSQEIKLWLANGLTYTPDHVVSHPGITIVYEVKGPHAFDGSLDKLKMAAAKYQHWEFWLVWKDKTSKEWMKQRVLP